MEPFGSTDGVARSARPFTENLRNLFQESGYPDRPADNRQGWSSSGHGLVQTGWLFRGVRLSNMLSLEGQLAGIPAANPTTRVLLSVGRHTCNWQLAGLPAAVSPGMSRLWLLDTKPMDELSRLRRCALSVRSPCRHEDAYSYENLQARVS